MRRALTPGAFSTRRPLSKTDETSTAGMTTVAVVLAGIVTLSLKCRPTFFQCVSIGPWMLSYRRVGEGQLVIGLRRDEDVLVSRPVAANAADVLHHPLIDRAEGIVREGIHAGVLKALLRRPAVPTLPNAGRALLDGKAPRRERVVMDQPLRHVVAANSGQGQHQALRADEPGGEMPAALLDVFHQILRGLFLPVGIQQIK